MDLSTRDCQSLIRDSPKAVSDHYIDGVLCFFVSFSEYSFLSWKNGKRSDKSFRKITFFFLGRSFLMVVRKCRSPFQWVLLCQELLGLTWPCLWISRIVPNKIKGNMQCQGWNWECWLHARNLSKTSSIALVLKNNIFLNKERMWT